ncbi:hypothetical protein [Streptomyces sp. NPDC002133]|uniref:hypothetical protein n=1 Tax=Streptomyces sp. NPDC002133 TaxID=3154409 RepID=UPI00333442FB
MTGFSHGGAPGDRLHAPDEPAITWRYPKRASGQLKFGYPLPGGAEDVHLFKRLA